MDPDIPTTPPLVAVQEPITALPKGPLSTSDLFVFCTLLGLQGFGGLVGIVQREIVDRKGWLTIEEFTDDWALAQALPGPNVINLILIFGDRRFGVRGAVIGVAGLLGAPLLLLLAIAFVVTNFLESESLQGALRGIGAVAAALIAGNALKMLPTLSNNAMGAASCLTLGVLTFGAVAIMRFPLVTTMLVLGIIGCTHSFLRIRSGRTGR